MTGTVRDALAREADRIAREARDLLPVMTPYRRDLVEEWQRRQARPFLGPALDRTLNADEETCP